MTDARIPTTETAKVGDGIAVHGVLGSSQLGVDQEIKLTTNYVESKEVVK